MLIAVLSSLVLAAAPPSNILPCRPTFVPCNYAEHFSGTVKLRVVETVSADKAADGKGSETIDELSATITRGKVVCSGRMHGEPVKGEGQLAVERGVSMEDAPNQPWYSISVACPEPGGKMLNIDAAQFKTYPRKDTTRFTTLAGKSEDDAGSDPANGVTATATTEWSLTRSGDLQP